MSRLTVIIVSVCLVLAVGIVFAASRAESRSFQEEALEEVPEEPQPSRAELVTKALAAAYPWRIERAEFREEKDDWALLMGGLWYFYAGGRLLPEDLLEKADEYSGSFGIPNYQSELPPWGEPSPEQTERFRGRGSNSNRRNDTNESANAAAPLVPAEPSVLS